MKQIITIVVILVCAFRGYSQTTTKEQQYSAANLKQYMWSFSKNSTKPGEKELVDFDAINNWRMLGGNLAVNNDGKYFAYTINKHTGTRYWWPRPDSLVVQSTNGNWRRAFAGAGEGFFSSDRKQYIFRNADSLLFLQLGSTKFNSLKSIGSYKTNEEKNWIAWKAKGSESLTLRDLATGKERRFSLVTDYNFDNKDGWFACQNNNKDLLLYNTETNAEKRFENVTAYSFSTNGKAILVKTTSSLQYLNLAQGELKTIWTEKEKTTVGSYSIDDAGQQVLFTIMDSTDAKYSGIWYYATGMDKAVLKLNNGMKNIPDGLIISDGASFTDNGKYIQFSLQAKASATAKPDDEMAAVEVWSSKDVYLQSVQAKQSNKINRYNAIATSESGEIVFVESDDRKLRLLKGDFALVKKDNSKDFGDRFWEASNRDSLMIVSLKDGRTQVLNTTSDFYWFSPDGMYLVYFDNSKGCHYFSCDLNTGIEKNISTKVPEGQLGFTNHQNDQAPKTGSIAAWIENETSVLVYDDYDIWKLDLTGKQPAINITNGFGKAGSIVFNLFRTDRYLFEAPPVLNANEALVLRAFNTKNKLSGYYRKTNLNAGAPTELYMGGYFMKSIDGIHDGNVMPNNGLSGLAPVKAKVTNTWIMQRQSTNDAPNFYETSDFKNYRRLTNYQPQKNYQWFTAEVIPFKYLDGQTGQGILYKPENFDPNKKYPVLIPFYGGFANNMYLFPSPDYINQSMATGKSPVWFLNNGYLVFTPDIAVAPGEYGPKAFSVIEGAAQYLKTLPYVDEDKLGIASHSWGAKLAAYMFTHSTHISATAITEGMWHGNMINVALSTAEDGRSKLDDAENGDYQFGNLWNYKDRWLDHTTVLNVDKSVSPLLLLCNKESSPEYQNQTLQLFTALRRLDKKAWWLNYDNGNHTLEDLKERQDYTVRYTQFFDHYLKNAPAPLWMTEGVPYKLKGIESRYELDAKGTCNATHGEKCLICEAWNKQYKKTPEMFQKEIKDWVLDKDIAEALRQAQDKRRKQLDKQGALQTKQVMEMLRK